MVTNNNVRVFVRFRPFTQCDVSSKESYDISSPSTCSVGPLKFTMDAVFGPTTSQRDFFYRTVAINVDSVIGGRSSSIIAYGQTAAGKSFTMTGGCQPGAEGVIPRAIERIFTCNSKVESEYVEIYNEKIYDLYNNRQPVQLLSDGSFKNARVVYSANASGLIAEVRKALLFRTNAATKMNDCSSRSHAVLILTLVNGAKLMMVDLAGSETAGKTLATGSLLKEAGNINKSLSNLAMIIKSLAHPTPGQSYVSYRNSKLTQMLQSALGGKSITTMIINCSPSAMHAQETVNSLRFGASAKLVRNKDPNPAKIQEFEELCAWQSKVNSALALFKLYGTQRADKCLNAIQAPSCLDLPASPLISEIDDILRRVELKESAYNQEILERSQYLQRLKESVSNAEQTLKSLKAQQLANIQASEARKAELHQLEEAQMEKLRQNFREMLEKLGSQKLKNLSLRLGKKI